MSDTIKRKCAHCKGEIEINRNNIVDVISYQGKYYHTDCFEELATQRAASKRGKYVQWQEALDSVRELEAETKKSLERFWAKDDLNVWLLENYNISVVPTYFWQLVADLECGKYKQKRCKPIDVSVLFPMWQWGQKRLNQIALKNKENNKGPKNDSDRIRYDLSILLGHIEDFYKYQNKVRAEKIEAKISSVKTDKSVNYSTISKVKEVNKKQKEDDISDILDEIFG